MIVQLGGWSVLSDKRQLASDYYFSLTLCTQ